MWWATCCVWVAAAARRVGTDAATLQDCLAIDDAWYFAMPARHFVAGHGFSFDGVHETSGFQPLWELIATLLAATTGDATTLLRLLCGASVLCWLATGLLLHRGLRAHRAVALLVGTGWLLLGFHERMAFLGMENGVNALAFAALVAFGLARAGAPARREPRDMLVWGTLAGVFGLARTENALLVAVLGLAVLCGLVRFGAPPQLALRGRSAACFALPVAVLLGGWSGFSALRFGALLPVSGSVKLFYESQWPPVHASAWASLWWHLDHVLGLALYPISDPVVDLLRNVHLRGARALPWAWIVLAAVGLWSGLSAPLHRSERRDHRAVLAAVVALFCVVHLALFALLMPHFTEYGTWYFSVELVGGWLLLGWLLRRTSLGRVPPAGAAVAAMVAVAAMLAGELRTMWTDPPPDAQVALFRRAGGWMERHLPAGQTIGCLSAGTVSAAAPSHRIVNLDGLANSREYFTEFLRTPRLRDYLAREHIGWFADTQEPVASWRDGIHWQNGTVPREAMSLVRWWRMDRDRAYCVWRLAPQSDPVFDAVARVQFDAEVLGAHRLASDADLRDASAQGMRVATSIVSAPSGSTRHVLVAPDDYPVLGIDAAHVFPDEVLEARFGALTLLGADVPASRTRREQPWIVTLFWRLDAPWRAPPPHTVELRAESLGDAQAVTLRNGMPCHDTWPFAMWRPDEVVVESYALPAVARGRWALRLVLHGDGAAPGYGEVLLTEVEVTR